MKGLMLEENIPINERSRHFDSIAADDIVAFRLEAVDILQVELGCESDWLPPGEPEEGAKELMANFREYACMIALTFNVQKGDP